jgi:site-specific DNA-methyltransferase (adenine-specific)
MNTLYCGDCLDVLRQFVPDESVDLVYIDPPFNSKRDYNLFFDDKKLQTQRIAFEDTWTYKNVQDSMDELHTLEHEDLWALLTVYHKVAPHAFPYLVMMALRLLELHRVLKASGSFYLHCDPTMSHYLKTVCDSIFGAKYLRNEIAWQRVQAKGLAFSRFASNHDVILCYSKSDTRTWNPQYKQHDREYVEKFYKYVEPGTGRRYSLDNLVNPNKDRPNLTYEFLGVKRVWRWTKERMEKAYDDGLIVQNSPKGVPRLKRYLDEQEGTPVGDVWTDILTIQASATEALGYPTQKPKALLERIIKASSNEGDTVLDAFCGCGTTIDAAESLNRKWIGIDISPMAISLIKRRLRDTYKSKLSPYEVKGIPVDEASAIKLWQENKYAFQDWWLLEFEVFSGGKGADKGIDGVGLYKVGKRANDTLKVEFQVKGGEHISSKDVDALLGILAKFECQAGVFLTIELPTRPMVETIATSGRVTTPIGMFPKLQLLTLGQFFEGKKLKLPAENITFKKAGAHRREAEQLTL